MSQTMLSLLLIRRDIKFISSYGGVEDDHLRHRPSGAHEDVNSESLLVQRLFGSTSQAITPLQLQFWQQHVFLEAPKGQNRLCGPILGLKSAFKSTKKVADRTYDYLSAPPTGWDAPWGQGMRGDMWDAPGGGGGHRDTQQSSFSWRKESVICLHAND